MEKFTGKVWVLGDDIDTDIIIPTEYLALKTIEDCGLFEGSDARGAKAVLVAAALTYVAALFVSLMQLLRWVIIIASSQRDDN